MPVETFDLADMKYDPAKEDGVEFSITPTKKIKVARMGNKRYQEALQKALRPYRHMNWNAIPEETRTQLVCACMARFILVGWEGITENGKLLEFSYENAYRALMESEIFRDTVTGFATTRDNFLVEQREEATKNSSPASAGS